MENIVSRYRKLMGATTQQMLMITQLGRYGLSVEENSVHGSDSTKTPS